MKKIMFCFAIFMALLGLGINASGQSRDVSIEDMRKTGDGWSTEVLHINRNQEPKNVFGDFFEPLQSKSSDGSLRYSSNLGFGIFGGHNTSYELSGGNGFVTGAIKFKTTESIAPRFGDYLLDIPTQLIYRQIVDGVVLFAKAHAAGDEKVKQPGRNFLVQALNTKNSAFGLSSITGIEIENPGPAMFCRFVLFDLISGKEVTISQTIASGHSVLLMDQIFSGLEIKDGNVEMFFPSPVTIKGIRKDNGYCYEIPVFLGRDAYKDRDSVQILSARQNGGTFKLKVLRSDPEAFITVIITLDNGMVITFPLKKKYKKIPGIITSITVTSDFGGRDERSL